MPSSSSEAVAAGAEVGGAGAGEGPAGRQLLGQQGDPRGPVELGIRRLELPEPVVELGERRVVLLAVLADVEGRQAHPGHRRRADEPQDRPVRGELVAAGEHRVAHEHEVGHQLVEALVVPSRLVGGAVGQAVAGPEQTHPHEAQLEPVGLLGVEPLDGAEGDRQCLRVLLEARRRARRSRRRRGSRTTARAAAPRRGRRAPAARRRAAGRSPRG